MNKILLLEDDNLFALTLKDLLNLNDFDVEIVNNGEYAISRSFEKKYDLFILDINVPLLNGIDCAKEIRKQNSKPILFLTSNNQKEVMLKAFDNGADDYLTKPIDFDELIARVKALLRRNLNTKIIQIDQNFIYDFEKKILFKEGKIINLGVKITHFLDLLLRYRGKVVTKEMIEDEIYYEDGFYNDGSVRVFVTQLNSIFKKKYLSNIRAIGYIFEKK